MTKNEVINLLAIYGKAWETQDCDLICQIFTEDATYDAPVSPKNIGKEAIRDYWKQKICEEEKDISFNLLNVWIEGNTVIAEWEADFTMVKEKLKVSMTEVAILTLRDGLFSALREYYKATAVPVE